MEYQTGVKKKDTLEITELLNAKTGEAVKVNGAVHTIRDMGTVAFVILRKREGLLQCVYEEGSATFDLKEINPEALPINFLIPIKGTPLQDRDTSNLTPEYCLKVLCLARLLVPTSDIRCAAGREIYFKGREKELLTVVNSIFASGYLTADGQGIQDTIKTITDAGFTCEVESD